MSIDKREQWRNLQETYRQMSEEELAHVAEEAYQLTDIAKEVLQHEITDRKLDLKLQLEPPVSEDEAEPEPVCEGDSNFEDESEEESENDFDANTLDLTVIGRVWDMEEALRLHRRLTNAGIPCYLGDNNIEDPAFYEDSFERGVDMKVCEVDHQWALRTLANSPSGPTVADESESASDVSDEPAEPVDEEEGFAICCPKCRSTEVVFEGRAGAKTGNEAFYAKFEWHCPVCNHRWEDDGVVQPVPPEASE